jgi:hypothetical protein
VPAIVLTLSFAAGCASELDPYERQRARNEAQMREAERARAQREVYERLKRRKGDEAGAETAGKIRRDLLEKYGPALTPFQRSALLSAPIASREEGEAMCRRWIEENQAFEKGRGPSRDQ